MNYYITRIITVLCITLATFGSLIAEEPRMEKAIEFLQQAQSAPNPVPMLEKAMERLQNATGNKGGFKVNAIKTIKQAITTAQQGGNAQAQISQAIAMIEAGIKAR